MTTIILMTLVTQRKALKQTNKTKISKNWDLLKKVVRGSHDHDLDHHHDLDQDLVSMWRQVILSAWPDSRAVRWWLLLENDSVHYDHDDYDDHANLMIMIIVPEVFAGGCSR